MSVKNDTFDFTTDTKRVLFIGVLLGIIAFVWALLTTPERAWINYLVNSL